MSNSEFWAAVRREIDAVRAARPETAAEVIAILRDLDPMPADQCSGDAFWSAGGSAGEYLWEYLPSSWEVEWLEGDYWHKLHNRKTGDRLEYVEGDVYNRTGQ